jgi:MFS family permease
MSLSIPATLRALIILTFAMYIVPYDYIGIGLATPRIRESLGFSPQLLPWILGGYVLTFGGFLILGGRLGDLYGRKKVLLIGLTIFGVCSLLTALAPNPIVFLGLRFVKGIGSALLSPNALASMTVLYPEGRERNKSFGISSVIGGIFSIGFFLVAGTILMHGWRYLLLLNVPLVLAISYFVVRYVPESKGNRPTSQFDFGGAILSIFSFGLLSFTVANAFRIGVSSPITTGLLALTIGFFATLVMVEKRHPFPLIPLRLLKIRHLVGAYLVCFFWSASNTNYPVNLFLQDVLRYTPQQASLAQMPTIFTGALVSMVAVYFLNRFGAVSVLYGALVTEILGIGIYATLDQSSGYFSHVLPGAIVAQASFLIIWMAVRLVATSGVPNEDHGVASGAIFAMQQLGNSFGIPTLAAVLNAATLSQGAKTLATAAYGFHWMFSTSIILVFIALVSGLAVIRSGARSRKPVVAKPDELPAGVSPEPVG